MVASASPRFSMSPQRLAEVTAHFDVAVAELEANLAPNLCPSLDRLPDGTYRSTQTRLMLAGWLLACEHYHDSAATEPGDAP